MVFKINISTKEGKTFKLESDAQALVGKELHNKILGNEISPDLQGFEFEIAGASDKAGFPSLEQIDGTSLGRVLLSYEKGMKKRPKREGKWKRSDNKPKGLRLRKTARGKVISEDIIQINLKMLKEGAKKLSEVFPDQNKEAETPENVEVKAEVKEEIKEKPVKEEVKEEKKEEDNSDTTSKE
jgi:small subunit ribosomal protein S6e|tara:strand:+ start:2643 stop:3191 length:549 start_codon:yes stop_codon:yes gene_type:complete